MDIDPMILQAWAARALEAEAEAAALRAQLDAMQVTACPECGASPHGVKLAPFGRSDAPDEEADGITVDAFIANARRVQSAGPAVDNVVRSVTRRPNRVMT